MFYNTFFNALINSAFFKVLYPVNLLSFASCFNSATVSLDKSTFASFLGSAFTSFLGSAFTSFLGSTFASFLGSALTGTSLTTSVFGAVVYHSKLLDIFTNSVKTLDHLLLFLTFTINFYICFC